MKQYRPLRPKLTYANVVATIALFFAVGGAGAFAVTSMIDGHKITNYSIPANKLTRDAVVPRASVANTATTATKASRASKADTATTAASAKNADHATAADSATTASSATNAQHAATADKATVADSIPQLQVTRGVSGNKRQRASRDAADDDGEVVLSVGDTNVPLLPEIDGFTISGSCSAPNGDNLYLLDITATLASDAPADLTWTTTSEPGVHGPGDTVELYNNGNDHSNLTSLGAGLSIHTSDHQALNIGGTVSLHQNGDCTFGLFNLAI